MTTRMGMPQFKLVAKDHPHAQNVAVLHKPYEISIARAEIPEPGDGEVRVKIKWVGVCGSDVEVYRGARKPEFLTTPTRLGHEVAGWIDQLGPNVEGLRVGDKVTCRYVWGAFAEYLVCKPFNVKVVPKDFPLEDTTNVNSTFQVNSVRCCGERGWGNRFACYFYAVALKWAMMVHVSGN